MLYGTKLITDKLNTTDALEGFQFTAISDSVIVSVPCTNSGCVVSMLHILHQIQYLFLFNFRTLVRGYISRGSVYHKNGILFGAGYSDAYDGEKAIGYAPRIVLDPQIVKDAIHEIDQHGKDKYFGTVLDVLKEDCCDGFHFIDYLKPGRDQLALPKELLIKERSTIKSFIEQKLLQYCDDYRIYPKYRWLQKYYEDCTWYLE